MKKYFTIPFFLVALFLGSLVLVSSCSGQKQSQKAHCGTKKQKKQKYNSMKSGRAPGGGMLN